MDQPIPFWPGRRAFVTGGTGFLGTWVVRELLARGAAVSALVQPGLLAADSLLGDLHRDIRVLRGRADDRHRLTELLATHEPAAVFHLTSPLLRLDRAVFAAAGTARPDTPVVVPVPAAGPDRRKALSLRLAADTGCRLVVAGLVNVFGPGDRRPPDFLSRPAEQYIHAADAARELVHLAERATTNPSLSGQPITTDAAVTGADIAAALADPTSRTIPAEALAWYRGRLAAPAAARRAA